MLHVVMLIASLAVTALALIAAPEPPAQQVLLDNQSVRVTAVTLPPGSGMGRHSGIEVEVDIAVDGESVLESPQGRVLLHPGVSSSLPGLVPHDIRNEGNRPAKVFTILLKRCD